MKCDKHDTEMVRVNFISEYLCPKCTLCPVCDKSSARIDPTLGVMRCEECQKRIKSKEGMSGKMYVRPMHRRIHDYSPEEVMSGVHMGMDKQDYGHEAKTKDWGEVHKQQVAELKEAL